MRDWILFNGICDIDTLNEIESKIVKKIKEDKSEAWKEYQKPIFKVRDDLNSFLEVLISQSNNDVQLNILHLSLIHI